jgi:outer membrane protein OmpA-like peptidoglycan-associated protein
MYAPCLSLPRRRPCGYLALAVLSLSVVAHAGEPAGPAAAPSAAATTTTPDASALSTTPSTTPTTTPTTTTPTPAAEAGGHVEVLDSDDPRARTGVVVGSKGIDPGWKDSRVNERNPNLYGQTGLRRTNSARVGKAGYFDLALNGRWFTSSDFIRPGAADENSFFGGNLSFGLTPLDFLEVSLATQFATNANTSALPQTLFTTGDLLPSVKLGWKFLPFAAGVDVRAVIPTQQDQIGLDAGNFSVTTTGLLTLDLYDEAGLPLRAHLNAGYTYQNARFTKNARDYLLPGVEGALLALTTQSWFYDQANLGIGVEAPLPWVTPFIELTAATALGVPAGQGADGNDYTLLGDTVVIATPGLRGTVGRGLSFDLAFDLGLSGTAGFLAPDLNKLVVGQPYTPAWAVQFGLSYTFNPFIAETQVELRETSRPQGVVHGCVTSGGRPVKDAMIEYAGTSGPRIVVDDDGCFRSPPVDEGTLTIRVAHPDHKASAVDVVIVANAVVETSVALTPAPRMGRFRGDIVNADDQAVEAEVDVVADGAVVESQRAQGGAFSLPLPPGRFQVVVRAPGYYQQGSAIVVEPLGTTILNFALKKLPTKRLSAVSKDKIEIASRVPFELGRARLLKAGEFVLDDVVDVLLQNPQLGTVVVEGHSDGTGDRGTNNDLSQKRAEAVVEYLIAHGVPAARLRAQGFGGERPIASNDTEDGRAKNRRVEFVIVGDAAPAPTSPTSPTAAPAATKAGAGG